MLKLTKNELRNQEHKLKQLERYLPTLQLKKAMLQVEVNQTLYEIEKLTHFYIEKRKLCESFQSLLTDPESDILFEGTVVREVEKRYENIAGIEIPYFVGVAFESATYSLFSRSIWVDSGIKRLQDAIIAKADLDVVKEKRAILEKELREVSIRMNLFEKILIPTAKDNIKKIKIFLNDQELTSVAQAKVAKAKSSERKAQAVA